VAETILVSVVSQIMVIVKSDILCIFDEVRILGSLPQNSTGPGSWLQIQRSKFDFRLYQSFREVVGLERGPLGFMSTTEELLER
jgi:hypothetical protein